MGVQRSGLSHLMSGRNKPSLDFVMKIVENFPEVDFYWLLNGIGNFPKQEAKNNTQAQPHSSSHSAPDKETVSLDLFSSEENVPKPELEKHPTIPIKSNEGIELENENKTTENRIERIVIFYTNGTYKEYISGN
jgi:hypothetical protein